MNKTSSSTLDTAMRIYKTYEYAREKQQTENRRAFEKNAKNALRRKLPAPFGEFFAENIRLNEQARRGYVKTDGMFDVWMDFGPLFHPYDYMVIVEKVYSGFVNEYGYESTINSYKHYFNDPIHALGFAREQWLMKHGDDNRPQTCHQS